MNILGISCFYHDSAATLVINGEVRAAAEEERFSREKHDNSFPSQAAQYCLEEAEISVKDLDKVIFYEKPVQKFDRILETAADSFPRGYLFFSEAIPQFLSTKLRFRKKLRENLGYRGKIEFLEHHRSHAASAFYPSPFSDAAILTVDGVGEWKTNQLFYGNEDSIEPLYHKKFPDSIGLLYSAITAFLGFRVNNDEYKVMGLASYGEPTYMEDFERLITIEDDGNYKLNQDYFSYASKKRLWSKKLENLLGDSRNYGEKISQRHKNIASTLQKLLEEVLLKQVNHLYRITDTENLCMAGGVALNSAANGKIRKNMPFENIWIQPAAGDDGGALGAALERSNQKNNQLDDIYLGPQYTRKEIKKVLDEKDARYRELDTEDLIEEAARRISKGEVIALYQGRLEWGPRALGNRSILADPRRNDMVDTVNKKVKFRESFRPFAPTVLEEKASQYFEAYEESPYMLFVYDVKEQKQAEIPAVTHVDGTSRIQTLKKKTNPFYYDIISSFEEKTGVPLILNTSFNVRGDPIVNTPLEAYKTLQKSGIDAVITKNFLIE